MAVLVRRPGLFTTLQDAGRYGYQHLGVPVAGSMDMRSHRLANVLVGNPPSEASLEVTLVGPDLEFDRPTLVAVTGADFEVRLDGVAVPGNTSHLGRAGQVMSFAQRRLGARAYVAVAGGFDVPFVLGSRSTHVVSRMGGVFGRPLKIGDRIEVGDTSGHSLREDVWRAPVTRLPRNGARVRVIVGPHAKMFGADQLQVFEQTQYRVAPESDRMGYRLEGERIETLNDCSLISSGVPIGSVQVPPDGVPIVLMADHQTTGGYPVIATVITADLPVVGQLMASDWIEFTPCTQAEAVRELIAQERAFVA